MLQGSLESTLKNNKLHVTKERKFLFQLIVNHSSPLEMNRIVELAKNTVDRSTVYRTIETFENIGIITRIFSGWKYKIELSDKFSTHHHHMTCLNCGQVVMFKESDKLIAEMKNTEKQYGFKSTSHNLELKGYCKNCC